MTGYVYAKGATTPKETFTTSNGTTGTELGSTSSVGTGYTNGIINAPQRVVYGYNRWSQSAMRQYYNSDADAGSWWTAQNRWDRPVSQAATLRGWLAGTPEEFRAMLVPCENVVAINTVEGTTEAAETVKDKIFLPSLTNMYISDQYAEGVAWDYYKQLAADIGLTGKFATGSSHPYEVLKKYPINNHSSSVYVRMRSAYCGYANTVWYVSTSGYAYNPTAFHAYRGCPACRIRKFE